jgi:hypothetical protein
MGTFLSVLVDVVAGLRVPGIAGCRGWAGGSRAKQEQCGQQPEGVEAATRTHARSSFPGS